MGRVPAQPVWNWDATRFSRCRRASNCFAVVGLVSRKWITALVSPQKTATQAQMLLWPPWRPRDFILLGTEPYFDEPFYVGYDIGGYELGMLPGGNPADGAITYWGVDDVVAAFDAALAQGALLHAPVSEVGGRIVTASVTNPMGMIIGFIFNPHFKAR